MKRYLSLMLLAVGLLGSLDCFAQIPPYASLIYQGDAGGQYYWGRLLSPSPTVTDNNVFMYDGSASQPKLGQLGAGLNWDGTTLSATASGTVTSVACGTGLAGGTITATGTCSLPSVGTAGTYSGVTTDAQGRVTAGSTRSFSYPTRSLNTCFQVSASRDAAVSYAVDVGTTITLTSGAQGTVFLRTYTNSGCSTGTQELARFTNGQTGALTIGLNLAQTVTGNISAVLPAGTWAQLVTVNDVGTPSFTARPGQETLL